MLQILAGILLILLSNVLPVSYAHAQHPCPPGGDPEGRILVLREGDISCREWWARQAEQEAEISALNSEIQAMTSSGREALRNRLIDLVRDELRDGPAARFRDIRFVAERRVGPGIQYCVWGRVNDKNEFGAYPAFQIFSARMVVNAGRGNYVSYMPGDTQRRFGCTPTSQYPGF